jgi:hypothetical protein
MEATVNNGNPYLTVVVALLTVLIGIGILVLFLLRRHKITPTDCIYALINNTSEDHALAERTPYQRAVLLSSCFNVVHTEANKTNDFVEQIDFCDKEDSSKVLYKYAKGKKTFDLVS